VATDIAYLRRPLRWAHLVWALSAGSLCILLIATGRGHPPPMVLVPVVVAVWAAVHLALWAGRRLALRGLLHAAAAGGEEHSWPPGLILLLLATAVAAFLGLLQLVVTLMVGRAWPFRGALWPILMMAWLAHAVCLAGLLLRRPWVRWRTAVLCLGWALWITWEALEPAVHGYPQPMQIAIALGVVAVLAFAGHHILRSRRIRAFLAS
jgi:hypothetical protein